jgi:uncharacterized membrane protein
MNTDAHRYTRELTAFLAAMSLFLGLPAHAAFAFLQVDYPGVNYSAGGSTELFGINDEGTAVGIAQIDSSSPEFSFRYDIKSHVFTPIPDYANCATCYTLANGIDNGGTIVGGESQDGLTTEFAFVLKQGAFELLSRPGSRKFTEARGVNAQGLISGYALNDADGSYSGFIYDPVSNVWTDVLPSYTTIAQGLNDRDELVGNVYLNAGIACPNCQAGNYGFLRAPSGAVAIFTVNGHETSARGITNSGTVTGFLTVNNETVGFVSPAPNHPGFQTVTVPAQDLVRFPGATATFSEGISAGGILAGDWQDKSGVLHGFIATPVSQ